MNKSDKILVSILLTILIPILILLNFSSSSNLAIVYYENNEILKIDLKKAEQEYEVNGYNGIVKIKAGNGKIKVVEETSKNHICSKQGYIDKPYETIICLPNKIVIKIASDSEYDATL